MKSPLQNFNRSGEMLHRLQGLEGETESGQRERDRAMKHPVQLLMLCARKAAAADLLMTPGLGDMAKVNHVIPGSSGVDGFLASARRPLIRAMFHTASHA